MSFSENLQFIRAQAGVTQEQLAEQLEVSRQSVSKWESAASFPEMDTLLRICDLYGVNLDTLLRGSVADSRVEDTARYDAFMNRFTRQITFSTGGIFFGIALMMFTMALGLPETLSVALFLLILTVAVVVMVAGGIQHDNFRKKYPVIADFYTQEEKDAFHQKFVWYIAGGVGAILFGVVAMLLAFTILPERESYKLLVSGAFLLIVAGAVMSFIYGGIQEDKYKIWKYNRDNTPTSEAKAQLQKIGTACGVIMLLATAAYVGLGLALNLWRSAWWLFAVGGILCAVASTILNPYKDDD